MFRRKMNSKNIIWIILVALLVVLAVYVGGRVQGSKLGYDKGHSEGYEEGYNAPHPGDTVFVRDTIRESYPVPVEVTPAGYELFPIGTVAQLNAKADSLSRALHDTTEVYIPVPIERQEFNKPDYHLVISGWHPKVELIEVYPTTAYITNTVVQQVPYNHILSIFAEAEAFPSYYGAKAGLKYETRLNGPVVLDVSGGYEYSNISKGPFGKVGLKTELFHK